MFKKKGMNYYVFRKKKKKTMNRRRSIISTNSKKQGSSLDIINVMGDLQIINKEMKCFCLCV
jgi:hypothetical protein